MAVSTGDGNENRSIYRLRWVGYGLLIFALIDVINIAATIQTTDPTWILQAIGQVVERGVVPLLGFALIFFGEFYDRKGLEKIWLRVLSWLCLVLAIAFFLMIPPLLIQGFTVRMQADQQVGQKVDQGVKVRLDELDKVEEQLNRSKPEELKVLAEQLKKQGVPVDTQNTEALKSQLQSRLKTLREQLQIQAQNAKNSAKGQASGLFKNALKWSLGALVSGVLFIYLWRSSSWAR